MSQEHFFDVVIVGGGISGTSLLYTLARYSDIKKIALFEKCDEIASLNSNAKSNSQTLHAGDIETNYSLKKALKVKKSADMLERYALQYGYENKSIFNFPKMVIAVGDEIPYLKHRYGEFRDYYPYLKFWDKERLSALEPKLVEGRESDIVAMGSTEQFCAMDFGKISQSFVDNAKSQECDVEVCLQEEVYSIKERGNDYELLTSKGTYFAHFVVVDAGSHSLLLANDMGYGLEYSTLPVGGSFYYAKKQFINSKVYTLQNPKLPFAAVHADPDVIHDNITRFGPTALALPKLERYKGATSCLANAKEDTKKICAFLGRKFDKKRFKKELS